MGVHETQENQGFSFPNGYKPRGGGTSGTKEFACRILLVMIGVALASYLQEMPLYDLQAAKFPPTVKYGVASLLSILVAKRAEPHVRRTGRWLSHVGRNAVFYYFAQGIGSSLNFYVIPMVRTESWSLKLLATFAVNLAVTTVLAELLRVGYQYVASIVKAAKGRIGGWL